MKGLILEGLAGTGKSTILGRLASYKIIPEEETTGDLVRELAAPVTNSERCHRLHKLLPQIEAEKDFLILERFHPTYFALMPDWSLFETMDERLAKFGFGLVLLDIPEDLIYDRTFIRPHFEGWTEGLVQWYGSQEKALSAFMSSRNRRLEVLQKTKLPHLLVDTTAKDWDSYVQDIVSFSRC